MKRRNDPECTAPIKKQKKRVAELALSLSSTSDDEPPSSVNHAAKACATSLSGSDSETEGKQRSSGSFDDAFKADSLVEGTSSRYSMYNSVSQKLMAKMGFKEGEGLGKYSQGRKDIVEASNQKGRRGLGLTLQGFDQELNVDWRAEPEPSACEQVSWFPECTTEIPDTQEMSDWMVVGKRKMIIEDETEFCGEELLHSVLQCKSVFDVLDGEEMRRARTRANPYEMIRGVFFLNRAAMKMANMDFVFDRMFTNPRDSYGKPLVKNREAELLYFADVCAGPGGFSEYVLWRKKWHAKGFGMTLKGPNDFKLEDFYSASSELFEPYYGEGGIDGDGDITRPENITAFRNFVLDNTDRKGVHFLMADGGFSVEGQENLQEILSKQLLLCQFLMALSVVRTGGHFICKTFDLFTPFSVGLIYLLYCCFERVCLFKPITSRPANSERYVVCKGLKVGTDDVRDYLFSVNIKLNQLRNSESDVNLVVPLEVIKGDHEFTDYMIRSNESHCSLQIKALAKIHAFVQDTTLSEPRQAEIRKECLRLWGIPDQARVAPSSTDPKSKFFELIQGTEIDIFSYKPTLLTSKTLEKIRPVLDYRCMVSGRSSSTTRKPRTLLLTSLQRPLLHFTSATLAGSSGSGGMASVCTTPRSPRTQTSCPRRMSSPSSRHTAPEGLGPAPRMPCHCLRLGPQCCFPPLLRKGWEAALLSLRELSWGPPRTLTCSFWDTFGLLSPETCQDQPEGCSSDSRFEAGACGPWPVGPVEVTSVQWGFGSVLLSCIL
uniref:Cap-specific mRNA (nucleoside-2'-O-)-methyltransferase 1 n=1 Tax=Sus scrofa TaxID=9823 RepID=A0A8D1YIW7_PIG